MPRPLGGAAGERLALPDYYADFQRNFAGTREFWKLERGQAYAEPGDASWEAFDSGDWAQAVRLIGQRRADIRRYYQDKAAAGGSTRRIRIVSLPVTPYLQWELHVLRARDEAGGLVRVLPATAIAGLEDQGPLPDIYTMDDVVMYRAVYDQHGVLEHAVRYTGTALVSRCRDFIAGLYDQGEPVGGFFAREIADLPPPPAGNVIPRGYLEQAGRPRPIRS